MNSNSVLAKLSEKEDMLIRQIAKNKDDLQLIACNGFDSYLCMDGKKLDQCNMFIGYSGKEGNLGNGRYSGHNFNFSNVSGFLRVILDSRDSDDIKLHFNNDGTYSKLSNKNNNTDSLLVIFIESPGFVQFTIFDGQLRDDKIIHIFTTTSKMKQRIRSIAYSLINQKFTRFMDHLSIIESDIFECEQVENKHLPLKETKIIP
jgi:hypothetical protein